METISINENNVWAGNGTLIDCRIDDCPAVLGKPDNSESEARYEAIETAIADGKSEAIVGDDVYTWTIDA